MRSPSLRLTPDLCPRTYWLLYQYRPFWHMHPITSHHREEAHVVLCVGPEQLRGSDFHPKLSFAPHTDPMVWFWASYHFPPQRRGTCCTCPWPWTSQWVNFDPKIKFFTSYWLCGVILSILSLPTTEKRYMFPSLVSLSPKFTEDRTSKQWQPFSNTF